jgi:acyl-coenzyme A thioesterase PaaI-like protein
LTSEATAADATVPSTIPTAFEVGPHHCFACGTLNENGLQLQLHLEPRRSWVELALDRRFEGWDGIVHGGILATILDEVMAWALVAEDHWGVTARMQVEFKAPVGIGQPIRADGWITRARRRIVDTEARLIDLDSGDVLATATGVYLAADAARKQELQTRYDFRPVNVDGSAARTGSPASATPDHVDRAT